MTVAVQKLLKSFSSLSEAEQHEAAVAILKNSLPNKANDLSESTLCELADELFQAMDQAEMDNAKP